MNLKYYLINSAIGDYDLVGGAAASKNGRFWGKVDELLNDTFTSTIYMQSLIMNSPNPVDLHEEFKSFIKGISKQKDNINTPIRPNDFSDNLKKHDIYKKFISKLKGMCIDPTGLTKDTPETVDDRRILCKFISIGDVLHAIKALPEESDIFINITHSDLKVSDAESELYKKLDRGIPGRGISYTRPSITDAVQHHAWNGIVNALKFYYTSRVDTSPTSAEASKVGVEAGRERIALKQTKAAAAAAAADQIISNNQTSSITNLKQLRSESNVQRQIFISNIVNKDEQSTLRKYIMDVTQGGGNPNTYDFIKTVSKYGVESILKYDQSGGSLGICNNLISNDKMVTNKYSKFIWCILGFIEYLCIQIKNIQYTYQSNTGQIPLPVDNPNLLYKRLVQIKIILLFLDALKSVTDVDRLRNSTMYENVASDFVTADRYYYDEINKKGYTH